ncbi:MAG TPA: hypothetical protein GXZ74_02515 [Tissierellia bacterium]|nr:hypothetical protein [Tissierellia bacterium]
MPTDPIDYDQALLKRLLRLIVRKQELLGPEYFKLSARYQVAVGSIEAELELLKLQVMRLRRRIQLLEAFSASEVIDESLIERALASEFYQQELEITDQLRQTDQSRDFLRSPLVKDEPAEAEAIFCEMIFKLHPAFHDHHTEAQEELLGDVLEAYALSDWEAMGELYETVKPMAEPTAPRHDTLERIARTEQEIEEIWDNFPYNQQQLLADEIKLAERQHELYRLISAKKEELAAWTNRYTMLNENRQAGPLKN